jgi:hypothetical protein
LRGALKSGVDALADHAALELRKSPCDLERELAHGRRGVDVVLVEVPVAAIPSEWR